LNPNAPARITLAHSRLIILGPADIGLLKELKAGASAASQTFLGDCANVRKTAGLPNLQISMCFHCYSLLFGEVVRVGA
jgi:hypothetical protein